MAVKWSKEDEDRLIEMNAKRVSVSRMAKRLGRTETAIVLRLTKLGVQLNVKGRRWTKEEEQNFVQGWKNEALSNEALARRFNRSWHALQEKACAMDLGPRPHDFLYLTVQDICTEMQVSADRVYNWFNMGLKSHPGGSKRRKYLVDVDDLLAFLKAHPRLFNAARVSRCLFCDEPDWFIKKRIADRELSNTRDQHEWTNEEDKQLYNLYKSGWSFADIAVKLHRTETAVRTHLYVIGCEIKHADTYTDDEIATLKKYSDMYTLSEMREKFFPERTESGLEYKCKALNIPYHFNKSRCRKEVEPVEAT